MTVLAANPLVMLQLDAVLSVMDMASCAEGSLLAHARWGNPLINSSSDAATSNNGGDESPSERPYDVSNNPLHLFIGREEGAADRGALVACAIVIALGFAAVLVRSLVAARRSKKKATEHQTEEGNGEASPVVSTHHFLAGSSPCSRFPSSAFRRRC